MQKRKWKSISLWLGLGLALVVGAVALVFAFRPQIQEMRAGDLVRKAQNDFRAGDTEAAYLSAKSAWLIDPGEAETADVMFAITEETRPQEAISWFLEIERLGQLTPETTERAIYLACAARLRANAAEWLQRLEASDAEPARKARARAVCEGIFGDAEQFRAWMATASGEAVASIVQDRVGALAIERLRAEQLADVVGAVLRGSDYSLEDEQTAGFFLHLAAHPQLDESHWGQLWERFCQLPGASAERRMQFLNASLLAPSRDRDQLLAAYASQRPFGPAVASLETVFLFRLGQAQQALEVLEDPAAEVEPTEREVGRIRGYAALGEAEKLRQTVEDGESLSDAMKSVWLGRAAQLEGNTGSANRFFDLAVSQAGSADWQSLSQILVTWGQTSQAVELMRRLLDLPRGRQMGATGLIELGLRLGDEQAARDGLEKFPLDAPPNYSAGVTACYASWLFETRLGEAADWLESAVRETPREELMLLLSGIYQRQGRTDLVGMLYPRIERIAFERNPRTAFVRMWLDLERARPTRADLPEAITTDRPEYFEVERAILRRFRASPTPLAQAR